MSIAISDFLRVLESQGVEELYHANTVTTACSFLSLGALCSRAEVENAGLRQATQYSDGDDKKFGIWDDVFLDTFDIHAALQKHNNYGPVLFALNREFLSRSDISHVKVTRCNPTKWNALSESDRWFQDIETLECEFEAGNLDQMIVVPSPGRSLRLDSTVSSITVDDPGAKVEGADAYTQAVDALKNSARAGEVVGPALRRRECSTGCRCSTKYQENEKFRWKFFSPNVGT